MKYYSFKNISQIFSGRSENSFQAARLPVSGEEEFGHHDDDDDDENDDDDGGGQVTSKSPK